MLFIINDCIDEEQVTIRKLMQNGQVALIIGSYLGLESAPNPKPINIGYDSSLGLVTKYEA
jgi:hypothetical protein